MYLITFRLSEYVNGGGSWKDSTQLFVDKQLAKDWIASKTTDKSFRHIKVYTEGIDANIDYKEKFEELYNQLLINAGIRTKLEGEKVFSKVEVEDKVEGDKDD